MSRALLLCLAFVMTLPVLPQVQATPLNQQEMEAGKKKKRKGKKKRKRNKNEVTVRNIEGFGKNKDAALKDAFARAIEAGVGLFVDTDTRITNDDIQERTNTYSDATIKKHKIMEEGPDANQGYRVKITAIVLRKKLNEKVKATSGTASGIEGEQLWAQHVSQVKNVEDGRRLLQQFFNDNPTRELWVSRILDDKGKVNKTGEGLAHETNYDTGEVYLAYNLSISYNHKKYFNHYAPRLVTLLDKIAHKAIKVETSCKATLKEKLFGKGHVFSTNCNEALQNVGKVGTDFFPVRVLVKLSKNKKKLFYRSFILKTSQYKNLFKTYQRENQPLIVQVTLTDKDGDTIASDWKQMASRPAYNDRRNESTHHEYFIPIVMDKGKEGVKSYNDEEGEGVDFLSDYGEGSRTSPRLKNTRYFQEEGFHVNGSQGTSFSVIHAPLVFNHTTYKHKNEFRISPVMRMVRLYHNYLEGTSFYGTHRKDVILTADELKSLKKIKARILSPSDVGL